MRPPRTKSCHRCAQTAPVLYRVRYEAEGAWVFVCGVCLPGLKLDNPDYTYGGTWKALKR